MESIDFTFKIAGEAGYGIASSGLILAKTAQRSGYFVFDFNEYPSLICGGHNVYGARISDKPIYSPLRPVDFLIALNQKAVDSHRTELSPGASIIVNADRAVAEPASGINVFPVPLLRLTQENEAEPIMMNNAALGACIFLLNGDFTVLTSAIRDAFSFSKPEVIELNVRVAQAGYDFAKKNFKNPLSNHNLKKRKADPGLLLTGNDALGLGMVRAGCKFFAAYPMTPINSLIAYFAVRAKELGMVYYQPEDEIAAINSALGAGHAGLRVVTATSGGGFSLMVEALGMAGMTETPLVVIEGQRPGPSSGLPTWTSQGDLKFVLSAGQDDFPRVVLAPGDVQEAFWQAVDAFNLAEKYQLPVIILVDKYLCESRESVAPFDEDLTKIDRGLLVKDFQPEYKRYQLTPDGISPRAFPGQFGLSFSTSSYEHDESGLAREDSLNREQMMEKRMKKMDALKKEIPSPQVFGSSQAKLGLVAWGSTKGAVREAQAILEAEGVETKFLHLNFLQPFPTERVREFYQSCQKVLFIEQNPTGQLADLVQEKTVLKAENRLLKFNGRPFYPEEIAQKVREML